MPTDRELMAEAIEVLFCLRWAKDGWDKNRAMNKFNRFMKEQGDAFILLRERMKESNLDPKPDPVAWAKFIDDQIIHSELPDKTGAGFSGWRPLYTVPQIREWCELTNDDVRFAWSDAVSSKNTHKYQDFAKRIEAVLKEKNA